MVKVRKVRKVSSQKKRAVEKYSLPTTKNDPIEKLEESVILIFGRKAIGKTSLANQFESPMTFMFERGRRNLNIFQVPEKGEPHLNWRRFIGHLKTFLKSKKHVTAVIDTIDRCYMECYKHVCYEMGVKSPNAAKEPFAVYDAIAEEFDRVIGMLHESGKGFVFLSHEKDKPIVVRSRAIKRSDLDEDDAKISRMEPSCKPAALKLVQEIADYVFYYCWIGNKRVICVRSPDEVAWTACGYDDRFLNPDGTPIEKFVVGNSPQKAFRSLQNAFNNKGKDINYQEKKKKRRVRS